MTSTSKKIVFFGNERLVSGLDHTETPILRGLIKHGYEIVAVVSHHSESRSRKQRPLEVAAIAAEHSIPIYTPNKPSDIYDTLADLHADAAVLVAYGRIITQNVIDLFPAGIINIHPSLLPLYRGPTPIESALLHGDTETGVSIMQLSAGMDEGPVYAQATLELRGKESKKRLYEQLSNLSANLLFTHLENILSGTLIATPQLHDNAVYCPLIDKKDGIIDWTKPAEIIEREIRAYKDWPSSRTSLGSIEVIIRDAHISPTEFSDGEPGDYYIDQSLSIQTGDEFLEIDTIQPLGKKEMPIQAFLAGYKSKLYP